jgi:hypothetical protein
MMKCYIAVLVQLLITYVKVDAAISKDLPIFRGDAALNGTRLICCFLMHYTIYPEINKSLRMFQYLSRNDDKFYQGAVFYPFMLCFMKIFGSVVAEVCNIYLLIRYTTVAKVLSGYIALNIVAKADAMMAMTLPSTYIESPLKFERD